MSRPQSDKLQWWVYLILFTATIVASATVPIFIDWLGERLK
jgi:hypothetical protein